MPKQQVLTKEKMTIHKPIIGILSLLVALILIGNHYGITYGICQECPKCDYSHFSDPETPPSGTDCEGCDTTCGLVRNSNCLGRTVTVSGTAESVQTKASKKGNTYYVFEICEGGHCIEAFSWTSPSDGQFSGNYEDSGYGPQLTITGNSKRSGGTENREGVDSERFVNLKSEIKMKTTTTLLLTVLLATTAAADFTYINIYDVIDSWKDGEFSINEVMNYFAFVKTQCGQNSKCLFSKFPYAKPDMDKFEQRLGNTRKAFSDSCITNENPETATDTRMNSLKEFYYVNKVGLWIHGLNNYVTDSTRQLQLEISEGC